MRRAWLLGLCVVLLTAWPGAAQIRLFGGGTSPASGGGVGIDGTPTVNQLTYWTNATTIGGTSSLSVNITDLDLTGATRTAPNKAGTQPPPTCTVAETFFDTDAAAGSNLLGCTAVNTWTPQGGATTTFTTNLTVSNTAPGMVFTDTTGAAKSLTLALDADKAQLRESAGASGSLLTLDLLTNRVGIGTASPTQSLTINQPSPQLGLIGGDAQVVHNGSGDNLYLPQTAGSGMGLRSAGSIYMLLDTDNNQTGHAFRIAHNTPTFASATELMRVTDAGEIVFGGGETTASLISAVLRGPAGTGTDVAGVTTTLRSALGTGTGALGRLHLETAALGTGAGTTAQTAVLRHAVGASKVLTNNAAIAIVQATLGSGTVHASQYFYAVEVSDGTDYQIEEGQIACHVTNKAGAIANNTCVKAGNQQAMTSGTLTVTFAISAANPAVISVNAASSLTPSAGYPRLTYEALNLTQQGFVIQ